MIQVAIIEDDVSFLKDLTQMISVQTDLTCLLCASSIGGFFESLDLDCAPDILLFHQLLDAELGVEQLERISKLIPEIPIIIMSGFEHPKAIRKLLLLGVSGCYFKGDGTGLLMTAIREVMRGNAYLSPKAAKIAMEMIHRGKEDFSNGFPVDKFIARLPWNASQREMSVIRGLIDGKSYKEIAASNYMTIDGVRYYVRLIYPKLGVSNRDQLIRHMNTT